MHIKKEDIKENIKIATLFFAVVGMMFAYRKYWLMNNSFDEKT